MTRPLPAALLWLAGALAVLAVVFIAYEPTWAALSAIGCIAVGAVYEVAK